MRTRTTIFGLLVILAMLAGLTGTVLARPTPSDEPQTSPYPQGYHPPVPATIRTQPAAQQPAPAAADTGRVGAQAAVLGKPGTVFAYNSTYGIPNQPYIDDDQHIHGPNGLAFDAAGHLYLAEEGGGRLVKFDTNHTILWSAGVAGVHDWGTTGLNSPLDVAVSPDQNSVWVADNDVLHEFDADGNLKQTFPAKPWEVSDDQPERFYEARGVNFDSEGHLYVTDHRRQRIQIFSLVPDDPTDGPRPPVYEATIDGFNAPAQMAFASDDTLYVTEPWDYTVKKCTPDKTGGWPWSWSCAIFFGESGVQGDDASHLSVAFGIGINRTHHVVYIADGGAGRLIRCASDGDCFAITTGLEWNADVAVDPDDSTITLTRPGRDDILRFFGEDHGVGPQTGDPRTPYFQAADGKPYLTTNDQYNQPAGIEIDASGNLYILEANGARMTKRNSSGGLVWTFGVAGVNGGEKDTYLDNPQAIVTDKRGLVYVGGGGSFLGVYNAATGAFIESLDQGWGDGTYQFRQVSGLAVDSANNLYVSDRELNIVKVYSYTPATHKVVYLRSIGTGECGQGNNLFCRPEGIAIDSALNLYVADHDNCRVQKFDKKGVYKLTFGNGVCGDTFARMGGAIDVAVDASGRVYALDEWNNRAQVFDKAGAYLTTIAGEWSTGSGGLRNPHAIALDKAGNVYISDWIGSRVQKYSPSVPFWTQININGFGNRQVSWLYALATFKNVLYAGGGNEYGRAQVWKRVGTTWQPIMTDGFEDGANQAINAMIEYKGYLYAATVNCTDQNCDGSNGGELWRSADGMYWQRVIGNGYNGDRNNSEIFRLSIIGGQLCAGPWVYHEAHGAMLWCSATGEPGSWQTVLADAFDSGTILSMAEHSNTGLASGVSVYAATLYTYSKNGPKVWRRLGPGPLSKGDAWVDVSGGWGAGASASGLVSFKGSLYVGIRPVTSEDPALQQGGSIYRCQVCNGSDWTAVVTNGLGNPQSFRVQTIEATSNGLYAIVANMDDGIDIWYSKDGTTWTRPFLPGLGTHTNRFSYWDNATIWWKNNLYVGVSNYNNGVGVWKLCPTAKVCK